MKENILNLNRVFAMTITLLVTSCGGGGGSDNEGLPGDAISDSAPLTFSQEQIDSISIGGILGGLADIFNQNVFRRTHGNQNIMANCPLGGTVNITGTKNTNVGITTADLLYDMAECQFFHIGAYKYEVLFTINGVVRMVGSWDNDTINNFMYLNYQSDALSFIGTIDKPGFNLVTTNRLCDFAVTFDIVAENGSISGNLCGQNYVWLIENGNSVWPNI